MSILRGQVWWWNCPFHNRDHIQKGTRPVVIVSNDTCNEMSSCVTVVTLTTKASDAYPQQVPIVLDRRVSIALAEQMTTIPVRELGKYVTTLQQFQMDAIDRAILVQLGLVDARNGVYCAKKIRVTEDGAC